MQHYSEKLDRLIPFVALLSSLGILATVFYLAGFSRSYWLHNVVVDTRSWILMCVLGAALLRYLVPVQAAAYFVSVILLYLIVGVGLGQSAATAVFVFF